MRRLRAAVRSRAETVRRTLVRRRFRAAIRPTDVFLVAYPRSGTTWLAYMLGHALARDPDSLTIANLGELVPEANGAYFFGEPFGGFSQLPDPRVFRVHAPYDPSFRKVLYVLRDPRDVLVSRYHFQGLVDGTVRGTMLDYVSRDDHWPCRWDEHVAGWLLPPRGQVLALRYEDIRADPEAALVVALGFIGVDVPAERAAAAVEAARFERMRRLEEEHGRGTPSAGEGRTIRRGEAGGWRDELPEEALAELERRYGEVMERVGYELVTAASERRSAR